MTQTVEVITQSHPLPLFQGHEVKLLELEVVEGKTKKKVMYWCFRVTNKDKGDTFVNVEIGAFKKESGYEKPSTGGK